MFIPSTFPQKLQHQQSSLKSKFSLLIWNIHKENQKENFQKMFSELLERYPSDIFLFQEARYPKVVPFYLQEYSYAFSSNIETKKNIFGVLTAGNISFENISTTMSTQREIGFVTHKSFLITKHILCNDEALYLVNIHAINFVSLKTFTLELQKIKNELLGFDGAMIIGGDFNSWSSGRVKALEKFQKELSLKKVDIDEHHHVKHVFSKPLDHILYRGLKLSGAEAIDTKKVSDHNPIYACFEVE